MQIGSSEELLGSVRVGSGPGFQLVDGGWSGLTGLQLTGVVSGRVVGGSGPVSPHLTIDAVTLDHSSSFNHEVISCSSEGEEGRRALWRMVMKGVKVVEVGK